MLRSDTLFGKRDTATPNQPFNTTGAGNSASPIPGAAAQTPGLAGRGTLPASAASNAAAATIVSAGTVEGGSKLIVGPNIKLKGVEITDCDTLVVEGRVEATMDSRVVQIAEKGAFKGSAEIDIAEIHGEFDGELTVREKLVIYATGKVSGKIRYGKLVIAEGGQLSGDVQVGAPASARNLTVAKVG
jgi:cytoskeletal protein CcmA (bactofilin family)